MKRLWLFLLCASTLSFGQISNLATINGLPSPFAFTGAVSCTGNPSTCNFTGGGGGSPAFSAITSGTNTTGLVMGTNGVLSFSGNGIINADELNGTLLSGLATGVLCNTTTTGVPFICTSANSFPGNAATATTLVAGATISGTSHPLLTLTDTGTATGAELVINGNTSHGTNYYMQTPGSDLFSIFVGSPAFANNYKCDYDNSNSSAILFCETGASGGPYQFMVNPSAVLGFSQNGTTPTIDTGFSRDSAGTVDLGNGTQGNKGGTLQLASLVATGVVKAAGLISVGTKFSVAGCGTATSLLGGSLAGSFVGGSATCTPVITTNITATNGYSCSMDDETTATALFRQTAHTTTTITFTAAGIVGATDAINFACTAF